MSIGGSSSKTKGSTTAQQDPYAPTIPYIKDLLTNLGKNGDPMPTAATTGAFDDLIKQASAGNPFAPAVTNATNGLLTSSTEPQQAQANAGYADYVRRMSPVADGTNLDIANNPQVRALLDTVSGDVSDRVNAQFAGAGRTASGAHLGAVSRGITSAEAPILLNQYNREAGRTDQAAGNLYSAGNTTANTTAGLQTVANNARVAGINAEPAALEAQQWGPKQVAELSTQQQNLPLDHLDRIANILFPAAQLGQQSTGTSTQKSSALGFKDLYAGNAAASFLKLLGL